MLDLYSWSLHPHFMVILPSFWSSHCSLVGNPLRAGGEKPKLQDDTWPSSAAALSLWAVAFFHVFFFAAAVWRDVQMRQEAGPMGLWLGRGP